MPVEKALDQVSYSLRTKCHFPAKPGLAASRKVCRVHLPGWNFSLYLDNIHKVFPSPHSKVKVKLYSSSSIHLKAMEVSLAVWDNTSECSPPDSHYSKITSPKGLNLLDGYISSLPVSRQSLIWEVTIHLCIYLYQLLPSTPIGNNETLVSVGATRK